MKFKNKQIQSTVIGVNTMAFLGGQEVMLWMGRGHEGAGSGRGYVCVGNILFLDLDAGYLDLFTS